MLYGIAADLLVVVHLAFVAFVVLGGFVAPRWPRLAWFHLPAVAWGVGIELTGAICPLTPLEQWPRIEAGAVGYEGDFIAHYTSAGALSRGAHASGAVRAGLRCLRDQRGRLWLVGLSGGCPPAGARTLPDAAGRCAPVADPGVH